MFAGRESILDLHPVRYCNSMQRLLDLTLVFHFHFLFLKYVQYSNSIVESFLFPYCSFEEGSIQFQGFYTK